MRMRYRRALSMGAAWMMVALPALALMIDGAKRWP
jgi:hypothetical protein